MSFDYDKHKNHEGGHEWVAFSDLYLCLSTVFLFLFVVASLRTGTAGVQSHEREKKLELEVKDLQQQIQAYNNLKNNYLETGATQEEKQSYEELMNKLTLLQDEANKEKAELNKQAEENGKKADALNKYQQMVRNIINSNLVASKRIRTRDTTIAEKNVEISEQSEEIQGLEQDVSQKKAQIEQGERKIANMNSELDKRMRQLKNAYQNNEISKKNFEQQVARLKQDTHSKVEALREQNEQISGQLADVSTELSAKERALSQAANTIAAKEQETSKLQNELAGANAKTAAQIAGLRKQFDSDRAKERGEFEAELNRQKLGAAARAAKEAEYRAAQEGKERALGQKIADLNTKMRETEGELGKARELANARKKLAEQIKRNFAKAGVKAAVDENTGDVFLDFGNQYFDTGRADLKEQMRYQLEKAMPAYSQSLFSDPKIAEKISGVEIVGFASPTYKGKYIDPNSLNPQDRKAVDYNLDLSYARAKAIFNYAFDTNKMQFQHQKDLLPLVKVTGRSFFTESKNGRGPAGEKCDEDCVKKAQRVIIKFNLGK